MMQLLGGPILRQFIQLFSGIIAATGFASESELMTLFGALASVANIAWVIYVRLTAAK